MANSASWDQILLGIKTLRVIDMGIDGQNGVDRIEPGQSVRLGARHIARPNIATSACLVLDHDASIDPDAQTFPKHPGRRIQGAACRQGNDEGDDALRQRIGRFLRSCRSCPTSEGGDQHR